MFDSFIALIAALGTVGGMAGLVGLTALCLCERFCHSAKRSREGLHRLNAMEGAKQESEGVRNSKFSVRNTLRKYAQFCADVPVLRLFIRPVIERFERVRKDLLRESCLFDLPEMIDVLSLALGAGLSFDQAFEWYLSRSDTLLAAEFRRAEQAYQVGMVSRLRAFEDVAGTLQEEAVLRFVATLRQAFTLGTPLAPALDTLSYEIRRYRASRLEERIAKTPVKLLIPLGACIVPAVLILLLGPIMTQVMSGLNM